MSDTSSDGIRARNDHRQTHRTRKKASTQPKKQQWATARVTHWNRTENERRIVPLLNAERLGGTDVDTRAAVTASVRIDNRFVIRDFDRFQRTGVHTFTATRARFLIYNCRHSSETPLGEIRKTLLKNRLVMGPQRPGLWMER